MCAGAIISIGLMKAISYEWMENCLSKEQAPGVCFIFVMVLLNVPQQGSVGVTCHACGVACCESHAPWHSSYVMTLCYHQCSCHQFVHTWEQLYGCMLTAKQ